MLSFGIIVENDIFDCKVLRVNGILLVSSL